MYDIYFCGHPHEEEEKLKDARFYVKQAVLKNGHIEYADNYEIRERKTGRTISKNLPSIEKALAHAKKYGW